MVNKSAAFFGDSGNLLPGAITQNKPLASAIVLILIYGLMSFFGGESRSSKIKPINENQFLPNNPVHDQYLLTAQFFILGSPDELLKVLLDETQRNHWDFNVVKSELDSINNRLVITYRGQGPHNTFSETIEFSYMVF